MPLGLPTSHGVFIGFFIMHYALQLHIKHSAGLIFWGLGFFFTSEKVECIDFGTVFVVVVLFLIFYLHLYALAFITRHQIQIVWIDFYTV